MYETRYYNSRIKHDLSETVKHEYNITRNARVVFTIIHRPFYCCVYAVLLRFKSFTKFSPQTFFIRAGTV